MIFITLSADSYRLASLYDSSSNTYNLEASLPSENNRNEESKDRNRWTLKTGTELREILIQLSFSFITVLFITLFADLYRQASLHDNDLSSTTYNLEASLSSDNNRNEESEDRNDVIFDHSCYRVTRKTGIEFRESTAYSSFSHDMDSVSDKPSRRFLEPLDRAGDQVTFSATSFVNTEKL